jgi:endonuclease YncB( thermonuclease family)
MKAVLAIALTLAGCIPQATKVIDGDSLVVIGQRVRLAGIDAPELSQRCSDGRGRLYGCGHEARDELQAAIKGKEITCTVQSQDRYGRLLAACKAGELDLNDYMVRSGWAVAYHRYTSQYDAAEAEAKAERRGIWRGEFTPPEQYRREERR